MNKAYRAAGLCVLACFIVWAACTKINVFERNSDIANYNWSWQDKKAFKIDVKDTNSLYNLYVNVRHTTYYPYSNLWVKIYTRLPDGTSFDKRVELPLADKEGRWYGEGMSDISDAQIMLQQNMYFNKQGVYTFELEQNMRQNPLPGVMSVGMKLENTHKPRVNKQVHP